MNIPGFTAEQSLRQPERNYSQRSSGRHGDVAGEVQPQFIRDFLIGAASRCCIEGTTPGCCRFLGELLAASLGG